MVLAKLKPVFQVAGLVALCAAIHALGIPGRLVGGLTLALSAASWGLSRGSLDRSGAAAAVVVGWITIATSMTGGLLLLTFFVASSKLTALCDHEKELDDDHKPGGNRDWTQVLSNSAVPTALLAAAAALGTAPTLGPRHLAALHAAVLGYYACCCGDTWASEIGQLSDAQPRLPWGRPVRPGTNGGVTLLGTAASAAGGLFMGAMAAVGCLVRPGRAWGWAAPTGPLWGLLLMGEWVRQKCVLLGWGGGGTWGKRVGGGGCSGEAAGLCCRIPWAPELPASVLQVHPGQHHQMNPQSCTLRIPSFYPTPSLAVPASRSRPRGRRRGLLPGLHPGRHRAVHGVQPGHTQGDEPDGGAHLLHCRPALAEQQRGQCSLGLRHRAGLRSSHAGLGSVRAAGARTCTLA